LSLQDVVTAGSGVTGKIQVATAPTNPTDVVRLGDLGGYLKLSGGIVTGAFTADNPINSISGVIFDKTASNSVDLRLSYGTDGNWTGVRVDGNAKKISFGEFPFTATDGAISMQGDSIASVGESIFMNPLGGKVKIGSTVAASEALDVEGNGTFSGYVQASEGFYMNRAVYGNVFGVLESGTAFHASAGLQFIKVANDGISSDCTITINPNSAQVSPTSVSIQLPNRSGTFALKEDLSDYVDKTNAQTIAGVKTFTSGVVAPGFYSVGGGGSAAVSIYPGEVSVQATSLNGFLIAPGSKRITYIDGGQTTYLTFTTPTSPRNIVIPDKSGKIVLDTDLDTSSPAPTPTGTGVKGQRIYNSGYMYECIATNTWVRSAVETTW